MDDQEWEAIVDDAQEHLLSSSNVVTTDQVALFVEEILDQPLELEDRQHIVRLLAAHPSLVPAGPVSDLWKRGTNPSSPNQDSSK